MQISTLSEDSPGLLRDSAALLGPGQATPAGKVFTVNSASPADWERLSWSGWAAVLNSER